MLWTLTAPVIELPELDSEYAPRNTIGIVTNTNIPTLTGNVTTFNGSVINLLRYPVSYFNKCTIKMK